MQRPAIPPDEEGRLAAVRELGLLDTAPEERFDRISRLLLRLFDVPIAFVALVDAGRQWFKSRYGLSVSETPREVSFCGHTILGHDTLVVPDARLDERFHDNPLVTGEPYVRFYAGHPLKGPRGHSVGTLCLIDKRPRQLSDQDLSVLRDLAAVVERELNLAEALQLQQQVSAAREAAETILLSILPRAIVERLERGESIIADSFADATILFADIHDFAQLTAGMPPAKVVELLNAVFSAFDRLAQQHGLEKIKTIGDAYMVAGGIPVPRLDHAEATAALALSMQREMARFESPRGEHFSLRIGINTGPVVAGVIGTTRRAYDLWGQTVNTASQMESYGLPGCIQVTEATYERLRDTYFFEDRGEFYVKGAGDVRTYLLKGRKLAAE